MELHEILCTMIGKGATDLHIKVGSPPGMRIDGSIEFISDCEPLSSEQVEAMVREILTTQKWEIFSREGDLDAGYSVPGLARFRISALKQRGACAMVIRRISSEAPTLESLKLPDILREFCGKESGLIIMAGPIGSGKSTTLAAMINQINETRVGHILTLEDPIEFIHPDKKCIITQREIGTDARDFHTGLTRALRHDPDVILVGDLSDVETISLSLTAVETGRLVLGTVNSSLVSQAVDSLLSIFPREQRPQRRTQLSSALVGVVNQTLVATVDGGRIPAPEVLVVNEDVRDCIRDGNTFRLESLLTSGSQKSTVTLEDSLIKLARDGVISADTAISKSKRPEIVEEALGSGSSRADSGDDSLGKEKGISPENQFIRVSLE